MLFAIRRVRRAVHVDADSIPVQVEAAGLPACESEYRFEPSRRWRFDHAWPLWKVAIEVEGGTYGRLLAIERGTEARGGKWIPIKAGTRIRVGGRHQSGPGYEADAEKYNRAAVLGWCVLRFTTRQVRDGSVIAVLRDALVARGLE